MARCSAIAGSLGVHGALALIVVLAMRGPVRSPAGAPRVVAIELVAPAPPPPAAPAPPLLSQAGAGARSAGSPGPSAASPAPLAPRQARTLATHAATPPARSVETMMQIEPRRATSPIDNEDGPGGADRLGPGDGRGDGIGAGGHGIGLGGPGHVDRSVLDLPLPGPTPSAPAPARARPPRLIYPARSREAEDSLLFVARLTIDAEGFVIGARLVRGVGGGRDDQAASAVWRFRYSPALDDDGRPIQATIEQRFLVE